MVDYSKQYLEEAIEIIRKIEPHRIETGRTPRPVPLLCCYVSEVREVWSGGVIFCQKTQQNGCPLWRLTWPSDQAL